jgi:hypothetical protein
MEMSWGLFFILDVVLGAAGYVTIGLALNGAKPIPMRDGPIDLALDLALDIRLLSGVMSGVVSVDGEPKRRSLVFGSRWNSSYV